VERWDLVFGSGGRILLQNVFGQRGLERNVPGLGVARLFQQRYAMIDGVVDVDIIGDDAGLDAPFLPPVLGPFGLELLALACKKVVLRIKYIASSSGMGCFVYDSP
jgi:hypothetical protein